MDSQLIELLDARRSRYLLWQTVGFALFYPALILTPYFSDRLPILILTGINIIGILIFFVATVKSNRNVRTIRSNPELRAALNNEMVRLYGYKSLMWAFFVTLATVAIFVLVSSFAESVSAYLACSIILYVACLSLMTARLVYLRK